MAPAPAAAAGLDPNAALSSPSALDEPKTTAGLPGAVANVGNALPGQAGSNGGDGGIGGFLTSELGSILGVGGATSTPARATTTTATSTTARAASTRPAGTTTSSSTGLSSTTRSTTTTSSTTSSTSTTSTTSTTPTSSATARGLNTPTTSSLPPTLPITSAAASPSASGNALDNATAHGSATSSGLSQPALIGIIVGSAAVGIFIILFVLRKLCLARRRRERAQWEEGLASYNAPKRAGSNEKVEAEVARRLNANVVAPMAPLPAALPPQPPSPRSPTSNVTKRPTADMVRPVQIRAPQPPPMATTMVGPYPVFAPSTSPPQPTRLSADNAPPSVAPYGLAPPPPSLSPAQATFKTVLTTYSPQLPDELPITIGERVRVIEVFEDGWAMVERVGPGPTGGMLEKGVVPAECLGLSPSQR